MSNPHRTIANLTIGAEIDERIATVALIRAQAVPAERLGRFVDEAGSAVALVQMTESDRLFAMPSPLHAFVGKASLQHVSEARRSVADWARRGLDVRTILDSSYPAELREIFNRPPMVFVRGTWPPPSPLPAIAVVGTRKPTDAGLRRARRLSSELASEGFVVLSGLAAGIDTAAHTAALDAGGITAAVVGTGLDRVYPRENAPLRDRILDQGGAMLSQFFPDVPPAKWTFPMRNVVMSGLSKATVVVEAGETSGARIQARVALEHGRTVFLLKSLIDSHEWAAKFVEKGVDDSRAIGISSTSDILDRLHAEVDDTVFAIA